MVIGRVGCGKSTFLSALNRFVPNVAGDFSVSGRVAYVAQQAWILNSTIRENILFGKPYDAAKYARCVKASQLQTDFEILPAATDHDRRARRDPVRRAKAARPSRAPCTPRLMFT